MSISLHQVETKPIIKNEVIFVQQDLKTSEFGMSFLAKVNGQKIQFKTTKQEPLVYGQVILANSAGCELITNKYNNPSSFDYVKYMKSKKVSYTCGLRSYEISQKIRNSPQLQIRNIREKKIKEINANYPKSGKVINALFLGYKDFSKDFNDLANQTGISHLLAISGTHLIVIIFIYQTILFACGFSKRQVDGSLFILLPTYLVLCGESSSATRVIAVELLSILFKSQSKITILKFVTCCSVILNPFLIYAVGFQLSYLISLFLYRFGKDFEQRTYFKGVIISSISIYLLSFPITINLNNTLNPLFFVCNLILIPLLNFFLLPIAIIINFAAPLPFIDNFLSLLFHKLNAFLIFIDKFSFNFPSFTNLGFYLYYSIIINYLYFKDKGNSQKVKALLLIFLTLPISGSFSVIDVGQGDSILIELPFNKHTILIDTGSAKAEDELVGFLKSKGINKLDCVIISHWHEDHYGNLEKINQDFKPKIIYARSAPQNLFNNLTILPIPHDFRLKYSNYELKYYPCTLFSTNENNNSLIFQFKLGKINGLLMGDAEKEQEDNLMSLYKINQVDFLKVGHHGSKTSSTDAFLELSQPRLSIISSGKNNRFHHPAPATVQRLKKYSVLVHDTQVNGIFTFNFLFDYVW